MPDPAPKRTRPIVQRRIRQDESGLIVNKRPSTLHLAPSFRC